MSARDRGIAAAVAVCLLGFYLLTFSGTFHSSDGFSMYAAADSIVRYGRLDTEQIRWMGLQQGTFGPDGLLYSRKGIATTILAVPLVWLGLTLPDVGPVHTALLLTPLLTGLTGFYLYLTARRAFASRGLRVPLAPLAVTMVWGLGSMAWPYSKTFFSEPVVALTLIAAAYHLVSFRDTAATVDAVWAGLWLGWGLLARAGNSIVIPLYGLALLWYVADRYRSGVAAGNGGSNPGTAGLSQHSPPREQLGFFSNPAPDLSIRWRQVVDWPLWRERLLWEPAIAFVIPIVAAGLLYLLYNFVRFGNPFESGYLESERFWEFWGQGIAGELISPGRGLLWYTPWLLALIPAAPLAWRRDRGLTLLALSTAALYVLFYGKWYMWHGGFAWGPRFLVPILPLQALLATPLFDRTVHPSRLGTAAFLLLGVVGLLVNLIGVSWDFMLHQAALDAAGFPLFDPVTFFDPRWAQIPGVFERGSLSNLDMLWVIDGQVIGRMLFLAAVMALAGLTVLALTLVGAKGPWVRLGLAAMAIGTWLLLGDARAFQSSTYQTVVEQLERATLPNAVIWHDDVERASDFLNLYRGRLPIVGYNEAGATLTEEGATGSTEAIARAPRPVWLISDGPDRTQNALDLTLAQHKALVQDERVDGLRLALYYDGSTWSDPVGGDMLFAPPEGEPVIVLESYRYTPRAAPGGVVAVELNWKALRAVGEDYQIFVHLVPTQAPEARVAQQDGPPLQGLRPTSSWQVGEVIRDPHAILVPPLIEPGSYHLRLGLYRLSDLARLSAPDGRDAVDVGPIEIR